MRIQREKTKKREKTPRDQRRWLRKNSPWKQGNHPTRSILRRSMPVTRSAAGASGRPPGRGGTAEAGKLVAKPRGRLTPEKQRSTKPN
jgi:hypothetical protein